MVADFLGAASAKTRPGWLEFGFASLKTREILVAAVVDDERSPDDEEIVIFGEWIALVLMSRGSCE